MTLILVAQEKPRMRLWWLQYSSGILCVWLPFACLHFARASNCLRPATRDAHFAIDSPSECAGNCSAFLCISLQCSAVRSAKQCKVQCKAQGTEQPAAKSCSRAGQFVVGFGRPNFEIKLCKFSHTLVLAHYCTQWHSHTQSEAPFCSAPEEEPLWSRRSNKSPFSCCQFGPRRRAGGRRLKVERLQRGGAHLVLLVFDLRGNTRANSPAPQVEANWARARDNNHQKRSPLLLVWPSWRLQSGARTAGQQHFPARPPHS